MFGSVIRSRPWRVCSDGEMSSEWIRATDRSYLPLLGNVWAFVCSSIQWKWNVASLLNFAHIFLAVFLCLSLSLVVVWEPLRFWLSDSRSLKHCLSSEEHLLTPFKQSVMENVSTNTYSQVTFATDNYKTALLEQRAILYYYYYYYLTLICSFFRCKHKAFLNSL